MLRIYPVVIEMIALLRPALAEIERRDCDLARQMRRAASSVALNLAEGTYSRGRNRTARYHTALGSMQETRACLDVAAAFGYLGALDGEVERRMRHVTGTLVRLVQGPGLGSVSFEMTAREENLGGTVTRTLEPAGEQELASCTSDSAKDSARARETHDHHASLVY